MKKPTIFVLILIASLTGRAQYKMSLQECLQYATDHHASMKNAELDYESSRAQVGETRAIGLPQINGKWEYMNNISIQQQFVPANAFNPLAPEDSIMSFGFGLNHSSNANITVTQLIFDGSYIMGLKAATTYKDLYRHGMEKTKNELVASVSKAYYMVLITGERLKQMEENEALLDKLLTDTRILAETGMVEAIDQKRTQVNLNNLKAEIQKLKSLRAVTLNLLKFQMGMPVSETLELTDDLSAVTVKPQAPDVDYGSNPQYRMLGVQEELNAINLQNEKIRYLPNLGAFFSMGANYGTNTFGDVFRPDNYRGYSLVGATLNLPIFSSGQRKYRIDQARIELEKTLNNKEQLEQSLDLQADQYARNLNDNLKILENQKLNMELAQEVYHDTKIKYESGTVSNFEVLSAQTDLKTAQTNYYSALYDVLIAKIELDKVLGNYE